MPEGLRDQILVRKVTQAHIAWTEQEAGQPGLFTVQLVMDDGADEYVLQPSPDDVDVLKDLIQESKSIIFDKNRKVLIFNDLID
jgi:hypothetical protein